MSQRGRGERPLRGDQLRCPVEEPVVMESVPGVQIPTLHIEEELGQEERGVQARDIHMIIPPIFEPLSPFYSPLPTEPVEPMSPFTESIFAALGGEHIPYDTATSAPLLPPSIPVSPLSLPLPSLPPSPALPPPPPVDLGELLVPASLLSAASRDNDILTGRVEELRRLVDDLIGRVSRPQGGGSSLPFGLVPSLVRLEADTHIAATPVSLYQRRDGALEGSSTDRHCIDGSGERSCATLRAWSRDSGDFQVLDFVYVFSSIFVGII